MTEERLNMLFQDIREENAETSIQDVQKWIGLSAASVGLFGLLSQFKMPILLTKKLIIMTSLTIALGIGMATLLIPSNNLKSNKINTSTPVEKDLSRSFAHVEVKKAPKEKVYVSKNLPIETSTEPQDMPKNNPSENPIPFSNPIQEAPKTPERAVKFTDPNEQFLGEFTKIKAGGNLKIILIQGEQSSVRKGNSNDNITPNVKNGELILSGGGKNLMNRTATVYVTVKKLEGLVLSGAVTVNSDDILMTQDFEIITSGASVINLKLEGRNLDIKSSGASKIELKGTSNDLKISSSGASKIDLIHLKCSGNGKIVASGASMISCSVQGNLSVATSGSSVIDYDIEPANIDVVSSGSSRVERRP